MTAQPYILLSAYACEPNQGSEPGVGFSWLVRLLEKGARIVLLTRANNTNSLEQHTSKYIATRQLVIHGIDIHNLLGLKSTGLLTLNAYYLLWQVKAYLLARRVVRDNAPPICLAWHITFSGCRFPTFLPFLPVECIVGPLAGEEYIPMRFLSHIGIRGAFQESLRYAINLLSRVSPLNRAIYRRSALVLFKTLDSAKYYRRCCQACEVRFEIGTGMTRFERNPTSFRVARNGKVQVLYVGRILYWKGVRFMCEAFARAIESGLQADLHIVGKGPDESFIKRFVERNNLQNSIHLRGSIQHDEVHAAMASADLLLMPSFRDSGGTVILESLDADTPVLALGLGGPEALLGSDYPGIVKARGRPYEQVVAEFSHRILTFRDSEHFRQLLLQRTRELRLERSFDRNFERTLQHPLFQNITPR